MAEEFHPLTEAVVATEDGLYEGDCQIAEVAEHLLAWIVAAIKGSESALAKITKKIMGLINRQLTVQANGIDQIATKLLQAIAGHSVDSEWTLSGLAVKAGLVPAGKGLDDVEWELEPAASLGAEYGGTLVLDCRMLGECLAPLIEVLKEIRDRISGTGPVEFPGELKAEDLPKDTGLKVARVETEGVAALPTSIKFTDYDGEPVAEEVANSA